MGRTTRASTTVERLLVHDDRIQVHLIDLTVSRHEVASNPPRADFDDLLGKKIS